MRVSEQAQAVHRLVPAAQEGPLGISKELANSARSLQRNHPLRCLWPAMGPRRRRPVCLGTSHRAQAVQVGTQLPPALCSRSRPRLRKSLPETGKEQSCFHWPLCAPGAVSCHIQPGSGRGLLPGPRRVCPHFTEEQLRLKVMGTCPYPWAHGGNSVWTASPGVPAERCWGMLHPFPTSHLVCVWEDTLCTMLLLGQGSGQLSSGLQVPQCHGPLEFVPSPISPQWSLTPLPRPQRFLSRLWRALALWRWLPADSCCPHSMPRPLRCVLPPPTESRHSRQAFLHRMGFVGDVGGPHGDCRSLPLRFQKVSVGTRHCVAAWQVLSRDTETVDSQRDAAERTSRGSRGATPCSEQTFQHPEPAGPSSPPRALGTGDQQRRRGRSRGQRCRRRVSLPPPPAKAAPAPRGADEETAAQVNRAPRPRCGSGRKQRSDLGLLSRGPCPWPPVWESSAHLTPLCTSLAPTGTPARPSNGWLLRVATGA